ncbi:MAG: phytoene/squalene synthase family protein [Sediminibacterium sp.]|jgi:phytoene/squalene synthetase|nr:phytoene/squalene synthase family protein [Sediminibacterium sp.]MBP6144469.1 phytoene/squalene synthase family protein [Sediminibacterium sp.]MBP7939965.1 phytoene/squalene synthase family protein [Sediminibacterium sp.]
MSSLQLYNEVTAQSSKYTTLLYSSSFSSAIGLLDKSLRQPIYDIYGFVRFADEIVDTFHDYDKENLLAKFKADTYEALDKGISLNPILHRFQLTYNQYQIDRSLLDAFLYSMEMDLCKQYHNQESYNQYIFGSAEVVGLMCLKLFCNGNDTQYEALKPSAQSLGAAFQKVNFLRDIKADFVGMERMYFPNCDFSNFTMADKQEIEADIQRDFDAALVGIKALPVQCRFGVYVAFKYYYSLFKKIKRTKHGALLSSRIRIPDYGKLFILFNAKIRTSLNLL